MVGEGPEGVYGVLEGLVVIEEGIEKEGGEGEVWEE